MIYTIILYVCYFYIFFYIIQKGRLEICEKYIINWHFQDNIIFKIFVMRFVGYLLKLTK